jgi:hypothetical protein
MNSKFWKIILNFKHRAVALTNFRENCMVFINGKEVIFHTTFLAKYNHEVVVQSPLGPGSISFHFTFRQPSSAPEISWKVRSSSAVDVVITPSDSLNSSQAEPAQLGNRPDGSPMYIAYSEQTMNDGSLVNFFILKGSLPTSTSN